MVWMGWRLEPAHDEGGRVDMLSRLGKLSWKRSAATMLEQTVKADFQSARQASSMKWWASDMFARRPSPIFNRPPNTLDRPGIVSNTRSRSGFLCGHRRTRDHRFWNCGYIGWMDGSGFRR